jgi:hypothetical protein
MKNKKEFIAVLSTLLYSWGGDTPSEAVWAANDLLTWYEKEYNVILGVRILEATGEKTFDDNYDEVKKLIETD